MPVNSGSGGGASKAGAIRAGGAFVEIFADDNALYRSLNKISAKLKSFAATAGKIGLGLGLGSAAIAAPVLGVGSSLLGQAEMFQRLSKTFGTSVEDLSRLAYAFESAGIPAEQFGDSIKDLGEKISQAADGNDESFRRIGLSAQELVSLPIPQQLGKIADALKNVVNPADRLRIAKELMGDAAERLLPVLSRGSSGLAELAAESDAVGATLSGEAAAGVSQAATDVRKMGAEIRAAGMAIVTQFLPEIKQATQFIREKVSAIAAVVREYRGLFKWAGYAAAGIAAGAVIFGIASVAAYSLSAAFGVIVVAAKLLASVIALPFTLLSSPLLLVGGALAFVALTFDGLTGIGKRTADNLSEAFDRIWNDAKNAFGGIVAALKNGDIAAAAKIAGLLVQAAWRESLHQMELATEDAKASMKDVLGNVGDGFGISIDNTLTWIKKRFVEWSAFIARQIAWIVRQATIIDSDLERLVPSDADINMRRDSLLAEEEERRIEGLRKRIDANNEDRNAKQMQREQRLQAMREAHEKEIAALRDRLNRAVQEAKPFQPGAVFGVGAAAAAFKKKQEDPAKRGPFVGPMPNGLPDFRSIAGTFRVSGGGQDRRAFGLSGNLGQRMLTAQQDANAILADIRDKVGDAVPRFQ